MLWPPCALVSAAPPLSPPPPSTLRLLCPAAPRCPNRNAQRPAEAAFWRTSWHPRLASRQPPIQCHSHRGIASSSRQRLLRAASTQPRSEDPAGRGTDLSQTRRAVAGSYLRS